MLHTLQWPFSNWKQECPIAMDKEVETMVKILRHEKYQHDNVSSLAHAFCSILIEYLMQEYEYHNLRNYIHQMLWEEMQWPMWFPDPREPVNCTSIYSTGDMLQSRLVNFSYGWKHLSVIELWLSLPHKLKIFDDQICVSS